MSEDCLSAVEYITALLEIELIVEILDFSLGLAFKVFFMCAGWGEGYLEMLGLLIS